jgi:hypothetical protein
LALVQGGPVIKKQTKIDADQGNDKKNGGNHPLFLDSIG